MGTVETSSLRRRVVRIRTVVRSLVVALRSTLLCLLVASLVGVVALWCRSYLVCDIVNAKSFGLWVAAGSLDGRFIFSWVTRFPGSDRRPQLYSMRARDARWGLDPQQKARNATDGVFGRFRVLGLDCATGPYHVSEGPSIPGAWYTQVVVPHWVAALVFITIPTIWAVRRARGFVGRKRAARGCCVRCGYDLRASRERCPECGTPIDTQGDAKCTGREEEQAGNVTDSA